MKHEDLVFLRVYFMLKKKLFDIKLRKPEKAFFYQDKKTCGSEIGNCKYKIDLIKIFQLGRQESDQNLLKFTLF